MLLLICENLEKMIRSKYRRANPKNPVFPFCAVLKCIYIIADFRFVFVFNCVFQFMHVLTVA